MPVLAAIDPSLLQVIVVGVLGNGLILGIFNWMTNRKKIKKEEFKLDVDSSAVINNDLRADLERVKTDVKELRSEVVSLRARVRSLFDYGLRWELWYHKSKPTHDEVAYPIPTRPENFDEL